MSLATIKFRRKSAATWTSDNTVLAAGEPGFELDTFKHKIGDGSTAWNSLPYAGSTGELHAGITTLSSGEATVAADWVTADTVINALPKAAPSTAGTVLYADSADIVVATSFKIKSDDATDSRAVFWMASEPTQSEASEPPVALPDTFYVCFRVRFTSDELSSIGADVYTPGLFAMNIHAPEDFVHDFGMALDISNTSEYGGVATWLDLAPDYPTADFNGLTISADTYYLFELKFELSVDHKTIDITYRLDGSTIGTLHCDADDPWVLENFALGQTLTLPAGHTIKRDFDYFKIGSSGYGTSDLFLADFTSDATPFDSLITTGDGAFTFVSAALHLESTSSDRDYALKAASN